MKSVFDCCAAAIFAALLGVVGMPVGAQGAEPLTAADYAVSDDISNVQISPDGTRIAYIGRGEGNARTIVVMTIGDDAEPLVIRPTQSASMTHLRFVSDTHLWLQMGEHFSAGRASSLVSAYVLNTQTRQFESLPRGSRLAGPGAIDDGRVLVWNNPFSRRVSDGWFRRAHSGIGFRLTSIDLDDAEDARVVQPESEYRYALGPSGDAVVRLRSAEDQGDTAELWIRAPGEAGRRGRDDGWRSLFTEQPTLDGELRFDGRRWDELSPILDQIGGLGGAGRFLYFASRTDGTPQGRQPGRRLAVFRLDLESGEVEGPVVQSDVADVDEFILDWRTNEVVGVRWFERGPYTVWFDPDLEAIHAAVSARFPDHDVSLTSWDREGDRLVVRLDGGGTAGRFYLFDANSGDLTLLGPVRSDISDDRVHPVRTVDYTSSDGLEQFAYLTTPIGREMRGLPVVVLAHQGPGDRDYGGFDVWAQYIASRGYAVLQPQYRGSTGFGADYAQLSRGAWGGGMYQDLIDALDQVIDDGIVDPERVCLMGADHGAHAAVMGGITTPDRFRCIIAFEPILDMSRRDREMRSGRTTEEFKHDWADRVGGDDAYGRDQLQAISPFRHVDAETAPMLIFTDQFNAFLRERAARRMDRMADALEDHGVPHSVVSVAGLTHGPRSPVQSRARNIMSRVGRFLAEHNPADEAEP
ncbi:alpha/beta hydrolase family protein [Maricaulis sp.]|uniref:alpha/beta hydrolase family protein n=1 Tax=Maricaulis sp. TaxID=1486257 RepID=UPI002B27B535|nr:prolyl oligopeptidase family serine peptidase [Maricaulis sp.]